MPHGGDRRIGRFIKKDAKILESVSLQDFSFDEINTRPAIVHDNIRNNLIHARMHQRSEMESAVKQHRRMGQDLRSPESVRPILQPLDFTEDWERQRMRAARGNSARIEDDEDEFELELEFQEKKAAKKKQRSDDDPEATESTEAEVPAAAAETAVPAAPEAADPLAVKQPTKPVEDSLRQLSAKDNEKVTRFSQQKNNLDEIGKAISHFVEANPLEAGKPAFAVKTDEPPAAAPIPAASAESTAPADQFIPVQSTASDALQEPEKAAIQTYKDRNDATPPKPDVQGADSEKARAQGYQDGFRIGEEKAALQLKQATTQVIKDISAMVQELEGFKKRVLESVQGNFYEICQAMGESLLQREFKINPEAFATIIKRAISETITDDKLKIAVHPEFFDKLSALNLPDIGKLLVSDMNVEAGNFRIDSNLSAVDGDLRKIVADLLEQADVSLFEDKDKAG